MCTSVGGGVGVCVGTSVFGCWCAVCVMEWPKDMSECMCMYALAVCLLGSRLS